MRWRLAIGAGLLLAAAPDAGPPPASDRTIDLARPFQTRSRWQLRIVQAPPVPDDFGEAEDKVAGPIQLCLQVRAAGPCSPALRTALRTGAPGDLFTTPHMLMAADVVQPNGPLAPPLLHVVTASLHSGDGDQLIATQILAYRRGPDRFERVYDKMVGKNNNQTVGVIGRGPLQGAIISAEPADKAPFGYWMTVSRLTPAYTYRQVLRYLSATRYADGNPLSVVDSEMVNIQQRLGLWHAGEPLPLPAGRCARPHLVRMELWCG